MVKVKKCSFCQGDVLIGRGHMYIKNDGTILNFCTHKCRVSMIVQKRNPRKVRWTSVYGKE